MKILVVDDEQDICEILQYNLETEGYEVDTANSAETALTMRIAEYDLILLDVMMGEMSGFQMVRKLKENQATAGIPIIFITALDDENNMVKGLNLGADDYIAKPLSIKEVKARVSAVLRRSRQNHDAKKMPENTQLRNALHRHRLENRHAGRRSDFAYQTGIRTAVTISQKPRESIRARRPARAMLARQDCRCGQNRGCEHHTTAQENRSLRTTHKNTIRLWIHLREITLS